MLPGRCKNGIIISKVPVMQSGLYGIMHLHFPDYELTSCHSVNELTPVLLRRADSIVVDLTGDCQNPRSVCERFNALLVQYREIHWVFLVSRSYYAQAVELLMCPSSTLLSDVEPIESLVNTIRSGYNSPDKISSMLLAPVHIEPMGIMSTLTLSERKVLRLLGKGWGINQIAALLKKSNKTISAQKNSAMRRLAIHSNAEMYAWINSSQGLRELNLPSVYGETTEWKTETIHEMSHS
ncbi:response regulator transcription factor [Citrobacter amalonaticus]|uniref:helix-turn-helix domain-containing protein n=1 Tax=Citrobacter amalonaticus TaxID=35703 RepID=UPI00300D784C